MRYVIFAVLMLAVLAANWFLRFDVDSRPEGTPQREWKAQAAYPKSYLHALQAFALMLVAMFAVGIPTIIAAVAVFVVLLGWEFTQRYLDWMDVAANGAGILLAVALVYLAPVVNV
jgi:hypothetical protein